jgi:hypothetical protein
LLPCLFMNFFEITHISWTATPQSNSYRCVLKVYPAGRYLVIDRPQNTLRLIVNLPCSFESTHNVIGNFWSKHVLPYYSYSLFFPNSYSRDLRSQRAGFHCRTNKVGCSPISFDVSSITAHVNPLVKGSARFLDLFIYSTAITPVCLKCLTVLIRRFTCLVDFKFSFALPTIMITLSLSQC